MKKLLLSCRDACAGHSIVQVAKILEDQKWPFEIVSQEPATSILKKSGLTTKNIDFPAAAKPDDIHSVNLLTECESLFKNKRFSGAIVGLSTPGTGGIDEAIVKMANCPTFLIQDFWGDVNLFYNKFPSHILACDSEGVVQNKKRHNKPSHNLGSVRHLSYSILPAAPSRASEVFRVCWLDQPLKPYDSYFELFEKWVESLEILGLFRLTIRPHPSTPSNQEDRFLNILRKKSVDFRISMEESIEATIRKNDIICSILSNGNMDAAYINHFSPKPISLPVHFLLNEEINRNIGSLAISSDQPIKNLGVGIVCNEWGQWESTMKNWRHCSQKVFESSKNLPDPSQIPRKLINLLRELL